MDFIVWIFAIIILYTNVNFLKNSVFHIARSLHSSFYVTFHQELFTQITICLIVCCCSVAKLCTTLRCQTLVRQAHLSMRFSRQEYWSGLPFPSPLNFKFSIIPFFRCLQLSCRVLMERYSKLMLKLQNNLWPSRLCWKVSLLENLGRGKGEEIRSLI